MTQEGDPSGRLSYTIGPYSLDGTGNMAQYQYFPLVSRGTVITQGGFYCIPNDKVIDTTPCFQTAIAHQGVQTFGIGPISRDTKSGVYDYFLLPDPPQTETAEVYNMGGVGVVKDKVVRLVDCVSFHPMTIPGRSINFIARGGYKGYAITDPKLTGITSFIFNCFPSIDDQSLTMLQSYMNALEDGGKEEFATDFFGKQMPICTITETSVDVHNTDERLLFFSIDAKKPQRLVRHGHNSKTLRGDGYDSVYHNWSLVLADEEFDENTIDPADAPPSVLYLHLSIQFRERYFRNLRTRMMHQMQETALQNTGIEDLIDFRLRIGQIAS